MFGAYQRREVRVMMMDVRAGAPPSGVAFLVTHAELDIRADMPAAFVDIQAWIAEILDTHLAYPMLFYFRSSHDHASWIAALGAALDAATLLVTTVADEAAGQATLLVDVGTHAMHDIASYFGMPNEGGAGVERSEFVNARTRLVSSAAFAADTQKRSTASRDTGRFRRRSGSATALRSATDDSARPLEEFNPIQRALNVIRLQRTSSRHWSFYYVRFAIGSICIPSGFVRRDSACCCNGIIVSRRS
jgi:hypothetical protein